MSEPNGPVCPACGEPRAADGTPDCSCGDLASEAHRDTRTAEAAAAEDFDPLRIRPFVELGDDPGPPVEAEGSATTEPTGAPPAHEPGPPDVPEPAPHTPPDDEARPAPPKPRAEPRRRHRAVMAAGAAAAVAVLVTGGVVGGFLTYESPSRNGSVRDDVRPSVPDGSREVSSVEPSGSASSTDPSRSPASSPGTAPSAGPVAPSRSAAPSESASTPAATATAAPGPSGSGAQAPVLRLGDTGPEVTELQLRLRQIGAYYADADGTYDRDVENAVRGYQFTRAVYKDEPGVYGRATRASLETETSEP
ncbi:peptidoglycan-binding protein [Streptomyces sp. HUAS ZL42]|uniref:peptidoglycan-binding domain-containing protein n=1 Tax=Streptomyces sp. HUAS ZL42 TaxID=3231715 RepID=UPI00345E4CF9